MDDGSLAERGALLMCDADGPPASIVYTTVPSLHGRAIHPEFQSWTPGRLRKSASERTHNPVLTPHPQPAGFLPSSFALVRNTMTVYRDLHGREAESRGTRAVRRPP